MKEGTFLKICVGVSQVGGFLVFGRGVYLDDRLSMLTGFTILVASLIIISISEINDIKKHLGIKDD